MMTFEQLKLQTENANWFENLGRFVAQDNFLPIKNLKPLAGLAPEDELSAAELEIIEQMEWLPSSRDQEDPFYQRELQELVRMMKKEEEFKLRTLEAYRITLLSLRRFRFNDLLKAGPHDFTEAAKGAALYAHRSAAAEIVLGKNGPWCSLTILYAKGHWPCGILKNDKVVVF